MKDFKPGSELSDERRWMAKSNTSTSLLSSVTLGVKDISSIDQESCAGSMIELDILPSSMVMLVMIPIVLSICP